MDFAKFEEAVCAEWRQNNVQQEINKSRSGSNRIFRTLDGPPFCNGTVHSGHILVSTIKDTIARYKSQQGFMINYQLGFDTHGLPIESEAEKTVGKISPSDSIEKIKVFNNRCREIIDNCSESWFYTLGQLGRQFDRDQTYYTCSFDYMQHLWLAFKKLYDQDLIYMSKKVMPYSGPCETPLSNFEATSNYKDRTDTSIYVAFKLTHKPNQYLVIWTTTPWSLLANQGICVNPELTYVLVEYEQKQYWLSENSISKLFDPSKCTIITKELGKKLANLEYIPIFDNSTVSYKVYVDSYVKDDTGTGLVHLAPLFGEDDYRVMKLSPEQIPEYIVDSQVRFTVDEIVNGVNINGQFVMDVALDITISLKRTGQVLKSEKITHSYPHCWRTDKPLVYLACDAWFINVQKIIPELLENNAKINWYPKNVGTERFANWIRSAPDWCISRNRVWGTPIPIWTAPSGKTKCIGTVEELERLINRRFTDLHLDYIHDVEFEYDGEIYKRTFGVLDCWFESGMAPTARYPFINLENMDSTMTDVDFISESLDQTRGWFYTLNVLSTALYHKPAYNNVIVSGLILAEDGKKMSKRLKNYTDPLDVMNKYGSDVLRMYLLGSPSTKADSFCFKDKDLLEITRKLNTYANAMSLYKDSLVMYGEVIDVLEKPDSKNNLDVWIYNIFHHLRNNVYKHLEALELTPIPNLIYKFIDQLCNTYIKLSRDRLKSQLTREDSTESLKTLGYILRQTNILLVPFTPHLSEHFKKELVANGTSIHLEYIDINDKLDIDSTIINSVYSLSEVFETVRNQRVRLNTPILYPLDNIVIYTDNIGILAYEDVIKKELNIKQLEVKSLDTLNKVYRPNKGVLGKLFKARAAEMAKHIDSGNLEQPELTPECYNIEYVLEDIEGFSSAKFDYYQDDKRREGVIYLSCELTESNKLEAEVNNIRRQVNILRKELGFKMYDKVYIELLNNELIERIDTQLINTLKTQLGGNMVIVDTIDINSHHFKTLDGLLDVYLTMVKF